MKLKINLESPLWTGGIKNTADGVYSTGIIGNLRWWYEALWRGMGADICDPSTEQCQLKEEDFKIRFKQVRNSFEAAGEAGLCPVCQVFGATGWARQFRLMLYDNSVKETKSRSDIKVKTSGKYKGKERKSPQTWERDGYPAYYYREGRLGSIEIEILTFEEHFQVISLVGILKIIEKYASLGSKGALGYGMISLDSVPTFDANIFLDATFRDVVPLPDINSILPDLRHFFFAEYQVSESDSLQTLTNLKYDLRQIFRQGPASLNNGEKTALRHHLLGWVKRQNIEGSKIFLSRVQDSAVRIWGWIPGDLRVSGITRDSVIDYLHRELNTIGNKKYWREFNSDRDSVEKCSEYHEFLTSLFNKGV